MSDEAKQQKVQEIVLDKFTLMVTNFSINSNSNLSVVLLTEQSTKFFQDALDKFTLEIPQIVGDVLKPYQTFKKIQIKLTNQLLETTFGF